MKVKLFLVAILAVFVFAACGRNRPDEAEPYNGYETEGYDLDAPVDPDDLPGYEEEPLVDAMDELFGAYQDLVEVLEFMVGELRTVETEEDLAEWREAFGSVNMYVGLTLDLLTELIEHMPENDDYVMLGAAVFLLQDGMALLLDELDTGILGDEEEMERVIDEFEMTLVVAEMITGIE